MRITKRSRFWLDERGVRQAVREATGPRLIKCALLVKVDAQRSMKKGGKLRFIGKQKRDELGRFKSGYYQQASAPGTPPHKQSGVLRASIDYALVTPNIVIVGPRAKAWYGAVHEFGGRFHPKRPFMRPALYRMAAQFPRLFAGLPLSTTRTGKRLNAKYRALFTGRRLA